MKFIKRPIESTSVDKWAPPKKAHRDSNWVKLLEACKDYKLNTDDVFNVLDYFGSYRTRLYVNGLLTKYSVDGTKRIAWKTSADGLKLLEGIKA